MSSRIRGPMLKPLTISANAIDAACGASSTSVVRRPCPTRSKPSRCGRNSMKLSTHPRTRLSPDYPRAPILLCELRLHASVILAPPVSTTCCKGKKTSPSHRLPREIQRQQPRHDLRVRQIVRRLVPSVRRQRMRPPLPHKLNRIHRRDYRRRSAPSLSPSVLPSQTGSDRPDEPPLHCVERGGRRPGVRCAPRRLAPVTPSANLRFPSPSSPIRVRVSEIVGICQEPSHSSGAALYNSPPPRVAL